MTKKADRIAEIAIIALLIFLGIQFLPDRTSATEATVSSLASARAEKIEPADLATFTEELKKARLLVDGNKDAENDLARLLEKYPGRHEVWSLSARYREYSSDNLKALSHYARAVRLDPDYLDKKSPIFLGHRIKNLNNNVFDDLLLKKRRSGLSAEESEYLKIAYFLRRRLAGGCE